MSQPKKLSKTRKLAVNRLLRKMTTRLDTCVEFPGRLDTVDLVANLDKISESISTYRRALVEEILSDTALSRRYEQYFNRLARKAMTQVGAGLQALFEANPDLLRGDVIEGTATDVGAPALMSPPKEMDQ